MRASCISNRSLYECLLNLETYNDTQTVCIYQEISIMQAGEPIIDTIRKHNKSVLGKLSLLPLCLQIRKVL